MDRRKKPAKPDDFTIDDWLVACDYVKEHLDLSKDDEILKKRKIYTVCYLKYIKKDIIEEMVKYIPHLKIKDFFSNYRYLFVCKTIDCIFDFLRLKKSIYRCKVFV